MILDIVSYPDPRLRLPSEKIDEITPELKELAANMLETMYAAPGVGLAAPQIGRNIRMIVMDAAQEGEEKRPRVFVNPELELLGEEILSENEGCLSVPLNYRANVPRHSQARVRGLDLDGKEVDEILENLEAIIVQHETDHLDGRLFIDRISHLRRSLYESKVKKWMQRRD